MKEHIYQERLEKIRTVLNINGIMNLKECKCSEQLIKQIGAILDGRAD